MFAEFARVDLFAVDDDVARCGDAEADLLATEA
jgi:hypothetical protein